MSSRSNNPFAPSPQSSLQATASKYPDISGDPALAQNQPQQYAAPQQQYQQQQPAYQQPQQTGYQPPYQQPQQTGYGGPSSSSFAPPQQSYSPAPYQQQQQYPQQQQQPQQFFSVSDLDPYANLGSLQQSGAGGGGGGGASGSGRPLPAALAGTQQTQTHPRQFVMDNKQQLMGWDEYCWKQLLGRVDALREAWEARKSAIQSVGNQGADPTSVDGLRKEADNYIDSIHAAKMQLAEVKDGWRHSTDPASKARVREALNAGLSSLPEYPPPLSPEQLGGAYHQRAWEEQRKSGIMSGYGGGGLQSQPTGYGGGGGGLQSQATGFAGGYGGGQGFAPQQTGMAGAYGMGQGQQGMMQPQQTGWPGQQQQGGYGGPQQGFQGQGGGYY